MTKKQSYWAIEYQPHNPRLKRHIDIMTISLTREFSWELVKKDGGDDWSKIVDERRRNGLMRAIKVHVIRADVAAKERAK